MYRRLRRLVFLYFIVFINYIKRETLNFVQEFVKIKSWLLLIFWHNQLKFHNSIEFKGRFIRPNLCRASFNYTEKKFWGNKIRQKFGHINWTLTAAPQGCFIAPYVWEIVSRKNLTIFKGCYSSRFYIMISLSFRKIETKNLNLEPRILILLVLGTASLAAH